MTDVIRIVVAFSFAGLLFWQSRGLLERPNQRRAYRVASAALLVVGVLNALTAFGVQSLVIQVTLGVLAMLLLLVAVVFYARAYMAGEMRSYNQKAADMAREFRDRNP